MSNLMKGRVLVIHIGDDETRVACLTPGGKTPQILDSAVFPTPEGAVEDGVIRHADAMRGQLSVLIDTYPAFKKTHKAVFVLQSTQVISQTISVPQIKNKKRVEQLVRTNADLYFPVDAADYQFTWQVVGNTHDDEAPMTRIQLWATPRSLLEQYYRLANSCGLTVAAVDYCGHSFAGGIHASFAGNKAAGTQKAEAESGRLPEREPTSVYIHLEKSHVLMSFVQEAQVLQQRLFRRSDSLDADLNEMFMEMEYFHTMFPACVSGDCVVSGSEIADDALMSGLEEVAAGPLRRLHCEPDQIWCMALGARATELDFGNPGLNARGAVGSKLGSPRQYVAVALGGAALIASMVLFMGSSKTWNAELAGLRDQQFGLMVQLEASGSAAGKYREYDALYEAYKADWEQIFAAARTYNDNLCLILEELESLLPSSAVVTHMDITEESLSLETAFQSKEDVAYFLVALRDLKYATLDEISDLTPLTQRPAEEVPRTAAGTGDTSALMDMLAQLDGVSAGANGYGNISETNPGSTLTNQVPTGKALEELLTRYDLTEQKLKKGLDNLTAADFVVLDKHYANLYETYTFRALQNQATLSQRKAAIRSLLESDALAMHQFFILMQEDASRTGKNNVLTERIHNDLRKDPDMLPMIYESDQALLDELLPQLIDILVKNGKNVEAAETLIRTHYNLTRKLAGHLAVAMEKTNFYTGVMDFPRLQNDILSGKTRQNSELDAVVRRMLTPTALEYYNSIQLPGSGAGTPGSTITDLPEQLPGSNAGSSDGPDVVAQELPGNFEITVTLGYKEELIRAEQARKGLDKDAMVQKVEVAG